MKAKNIILAIIIAVVAAEIIFMIKGNGRLSLLRSQRANLESAIDLSNKGVMLSKQGEYSKALQMMGEAVRLAPADSLIGQNFKAVYFNFCVSLIGQGKYEEALDVSGNGLALMPEEPALLYAKAEAFYGLNRIDSAETYVNRALAGERIDAEVVQRILDLGARCRQEGTLQFSQTGYFDIKFEGGENRELADKILYILEDIRDQQGAQFGWQARKEIHVILYGDKQFSDITNVASWAGAAFDGKIRIPVANLRNGDEILHRVLVHEFVHALLFEIGGRKFPGWFNEGLAQYQEGLSPAQEVYMPLSELSGSFMKLDRDNAQKAYQASLSAVNFLIADNGWELVRLFVNNMGKGGEFDATFKETFNLTVEQFDQKWRKKIVG